MKEIIFGGAMLTSFIIFIIFIVSISIFLWKWSIDIINSFKDDFNKGFQDAMKDYIQK